MAQGRLVYSRDFPHKTSPYLRADSQHNPFAPSSRLHLHDQLIVLMTNKETSEWVDYFQVSDVHSEAFLKANLTVIERISDFEHYSARLHSEFVQYGVFSLTLMKFPTRLQQGRLKGGSVASLTIGFPSGQVYILNLYALGMCAGDGWRAKLPSPLKEDLVEFNSVLVADAPGSLFPEFDTAKPGECVDTAEIVERLVNDPTWPYSLEGTAKTDLTVVPELVYNTCFGPISRKALKRHANQMPHFVPEDWPTSLFLNSCCSKRRQHAVYSMN
jgi:hypothetical protein